MWKLNSHRVGTASTVSVLAGDAPMSCKDVLREWRANEPFCRFWLNALRDVPYEAYCWETPPWTRATLARPFECVFVESSGLVRVRADPVPFARRFQDPSAESIAVFENLGRDALLVAPRPEKTRTDYAHLASFSRSAPDTHAAGLWPAVARGIEERVGTVPVWVSTAGLGVHWLHVRIDSIPKYYRHRAYASPDFWKDRPLSGLASGAA